MAAIPVVIITLFSSPQTWAVRRYYPQGVGALAQHLPPLSIAYLLRSSWPFRLRALPVFAGVAAISSVCTVYLHGKHFARAGKVSASL